MNAGQPKPRESEDFLSLLTREVIPRLAVLERGQGPAGKSLEAGETLLERLSQALSFDQSHPHYADVVRLADLSLGPSSPECLAFVEQRIEHGLPVESVFLELIQPAARLLGERWVMDTCSFADVTIGLWNLQRVFNELLERFHSEPHPRVPSGGRPAIFLTGMPGGQHRLGLMMVGAFFARQGWSVQLHEATEEPNLLEAAAHSQSELIGLSIGSENEMKLAAAFILRLRQICRQKNKNYVPLIMIGGPAVTLFPTLAQQAGADLITGDAPQAVAAAESLLLAKRSLHGSD